MKKKLLFLCTGNSCRSQMAEGLCRHLRGDEFEVFSAGVEKHGLNPLAVKVMQEIGIDISGHFSKTVDELDSVTLDYVVAVCGHADETCPAFAPATKRIYRGFDDPPKLAADAASEDEALAHYRRVRDDIRSYIEGLSAGDFDATAGLSR
ncbi:MAG: arsenate reductase ArsC [Woeseiaceae bacterium]